MIRAITIFVGSHWVLPKRKVVVGASCTNGPFCRFEYFFFSRKTTEYLHLLAPRFRGSRPGDLWEILLDGNYLNVTQAYIFMHQVNGYKEKVVGFGKAFEIKCNPHCKGTWVGFDFLQSRSRIVTFLWWNANNIGNHIYCNSISAIQSIVNWK